jgi:hypothetical protein
MAIKPIAPFSITSIAIAISQLEVMISISAATSMILSLE